MASDFDLEVVRRLPLAEAAHRLLEYALAPDFLSAVFAQHRGRSYNQALAFPDFVHLIAEALLGAKGSAHQTFQQARAAATVTISIQSLYARLRNVPLTLSAGFFAAVAARLQPLGAAVTHPMPGSLAAFQVLGFDGKKLKYVAHKLKSLRAVRGNVYGGKLLVVLDLATRQAVGLAAAADGEAADNPLVPAAVAQVRAAADRRRLWVGDRAFCECATLQNLSEGTDGFVVRFSRSTQFHCDSSIPRRSGVDDQQRPFVEEWGWLGAASNPRRRRVRKITVTRPSADPFAIVTNLSDADAVPATDLLTLYRERWGLETCFQQVVQTFDLRHLIGSTPQATVFQAAFCLLLYNITLVVRSLAAGTRRSAHDISMKLLYDDLVRQMTAWHEMLDLDTTLAVLAAVPRTSEAALRQHLQTVLEQCSATEWKKSPKKKKSPPTVRHYLKGGHSSVEKIRRGVHQIATPSG